MSSSLIIVTLVNILSVVVLKSLLNSSILLGSVISIVSFSKRSFKIAKSIFSSKYSKTGTTFKFGWRFHASLILLSTSIASLESSNLALLLLLVY